MRFNRIGTMGVVVTLASVFAQVGCSESTLSGGPARIGRCEGKCDDPVAAPLWGAELARCWIKAGDDDDLFRIDVVVCRRGVAGAFPVDVRPVIVEARDSAGDLEVAARLDLEPGAEGRAFLIRVDSYPVTLRVEAWTDFDVAGLGADASHPLFSLSASRVVAKPPGGAVVDPVAVRVPFDVWRVELLGVAPYGVVTIDSYALNLAPMVSGATSTISVSPESEVVSAGERVSVALAVRSGEASMAAKATLYRGDSTTREVAFAFDGPGTYVVAEAGVRRATADEVEAFGVTAVDAGEDAGADADAGAVADAGADADAGAVADADADAGAVADADADAGAVADADADADAGAVADADAVADAGEQPVDPTPGCGAPTESCCGGLYGTCDPGSYCSSSSGRCVACGHADEPCCGGWHGTCGSGAYCSSSSGRCVACGHADEPCCGGWNGTCEAGLSCSGGSCR